MEDSEDINEVEKDTTIAPATTPCTADSDGKGKEKKSATQETEANQKDKEKASSSSNDCRTTAEGTSQEKQLPDVKIVQTHADLNAATGQEQDTNKETPEEKKDTVPDTKKATTQTQGTTHTTND